MSPTIILVAILVFSFLVARVLARLSHGGTAAIGIEFLLIGILLGPTTAPRVLTDEVLATLDLFVSLLLGLVGFLAGLGLGRGFRDFEVGMAGVVSSLGVILCVAIMAAGAVQVAHPEILTSADPMFAVPLLANRSHLYSLWLAPEALWVGLALAAAAGVSSSKFVARVAAREGAIGRRSELLEGLAIASHGTAILVLGVAMAGNRATGSASELGLTLTEWGAIGIGLGACSGLLFSVYLGREQDTMRMMVAAIGAVTFAAGAGAALRVSPLFVNLVAGAIVAMTSPHAGKLGAALEPLEYPASVLVLLFAGAYWRPVDGWLWLLPIAYVLIRWAARRVLTPLAVDTFVADHSISRGLGRGMLGHGVLAAAIGLGFAQSFPEYAPLVLTTVLGGMLITDLVYARVLHRFFADSGDIRPVEGGAER